MLQSIRRFFSAPVCEDDEETLRAKHLTIIIHAVLLSTLVYSVLTPLFAPQLTPRMWLILPMYPVILAMYWLAHKRKIRAASLLMIGGIWIILLLSAALSGGTQAPAFAGNMIIILSAAVLVDYSTAVLFAILSAVSGLLMIWGESVGYLSYASQRLNTPFTDWLAEIIYFIVGVALVSMATERIRFALQRAQTELGGRHQIEVELKKERDFAIQVMEELGQGVTVTDENSKFQYVNPAYARMLNYSQSDFMGKMPRDFTAQEDFSILDQAHSERMGGKTTTYETQLKKSNGEIVHALITGVPRIVNGRYAGSIAVITDLTERKRIESQQSELLSKMNLRNLQLHTAAEVSRIASSMVDLDVLMPKLLN